MVPRLLQGIYGALGELFYIPYISGRNQQTEPIPISERQRPGSNATQLENYLGMHGLSPESINGSLRNMGINQTFERLVDQYPRLVGTVKSAALDMATGTTRSLFSRDDKSWYIADRIISDLPEPGPKSRIPVQE